MKRILAVGLMAALTVLVLVGCETVGPGVSPLETPGGEGTAGIPVAVELSGPGIAAILALITSLALMYVPGFSTWWDAFAYKREVLAGAGFVIAVALVGLHYLGAIDLGLGGFGWPVIWKAIEAWLSFAGTGQLIYTGKRSLTK